MLRSMEPARRRATLLASLALASVPLHAQGSPRKPLPDYLPLPPGFALFNGGGRDWVVERGHEHFDYQPSPRQSTVYTAADGHAWLLVARATPATASPLDQAAVNAQIRPLLVVQGWTLLQEMPWIIARREKAGQISWVKLQGNSDQWAIVLVEQAPRSRFIELVPPGAQPESLQAGAEPPAYVGHFPGSTLKTSRIWPDRTMEILVPGAKESNWLGRPLFQAEYTGPGDLSPFEFAEAYSDALSKAGWTILKNTGGGTSGSAVLWARFSNAARDLWLSLGATNFGYEVLLADAVAQAEVRRLKEELDKNGHVALYGIYFDSDSSTLKPESEATLQQILKLLTANPGLKLGIEGHTDNTGARPHNQTLSEARAASVKRWLVEHKISADRLTTAGFADTRPVADNGSPAGRAKNRRVELVSGATTPAPAGQPGYRRQP